MTLGNIGVIVTAVVLLQLITKKLTTSNQYLTASKEAVKWLNGCSNQYFKCIQCCISTSCCFTCGHCSVKSDCRERQSDAVVKPI